MAQIQLKRARIPSDISVGLYLKDNGVAVSWASLEDIKVMAFSVDQNVAVGPCSAMPDASDPTRLNVEYTGEIPQYPGTAKLVVFCKYHGRLKSYDVPVVYFVKSTEDVTGYQVIDDPEVDIAIQVEDSGDPSVVLEVADVSTSLLDNAIAEALDAAEKAASATSDAEAAAKEAQTATENANAAATAANKAKQDANSAAGRANSSAKNADNAAAAAKEAAQEAADTATKSPYIGDNGNWFVYDAVQKVYVDTGIKAQGSQGQVGPQGPKGLQGPKGDTGAKGDPGATGPQGPQGEQGERGPSGVTSVEVAVSPSTGTPSASGTVENGVLSLSFSGLKGETGPQGAKGDTGPQGAKGDTGPQGAKGDTGATGAQGPKGEKGDPGPTDVFWAEYGVTTAAEIDAAVAEEKAVMCKYNGASYVQTQANNSAIYFGSVHNDFASRLELNRRDNTWSSNAIQLEWVGHKVKSWNATPNNTAYPSEKLVKDSLDSKYTKPSTGIPASDIAEGVIPDVAQFITRSVNDLVNYYLKSEVYTKDEVAALIGAIQQFHYEIAASTSAVTTPSNNVLYLIGPSGEGADRYEEYVYSSGWVKIGDTSIDLSGYVTTQALNAALANYATNASLATVAKSGSYKDLSGKPAISTNIKNDKTSDVMMASPKAVYDEVHPATANVQPQGGMLPNVMYVLGELSGNTTFALASPNDANVVNHYYWTFETGATAPTITWPAGISWFGGSAPTISANKHYEISVVNNIAVSMEV